MSRRINKKKASALLEQAKLHLGLGQAAKAEEILSEIAYQSELQAAVLFSALAEAQDAPERLSEVVATLSEGLRRFPGDPDLEARLGHVLLRQDLIGEGLRHFERARPKLGRDPSFLTQYAFALTRAGRIDEAEACLSTALVSGGGHEARLVMAIIRGQRGSYAQAEELAMAVESGAKKPELVAAARAVRADCRLFLGDALGALGFWKPLREAGSLEDAQLAHMAYAAQLAGEIELCDELIAQRTERGPTAEDLLLFAQVANLRSRPGEALAHLEAAENAGGERHPGHDFEVLSTRGRALRLLGRREQAQATLAKAMALPELGNPRLGPKVRVDLGHLYAEAGDFEAAEAQFKLALAADGEDPEAKHGLALTARRVAWRDELAASAEAKVEAARAEAEALRRRFSSREGELEALRRELERMTAAKAEAEAAALRAAQDADRHAAAGQAEQQRKLQEELAAREAESVQKARENLARALGDRQGRCPPALLVLLEVAEQTFQKALYTDLPAVAVAVLYTGALERALFILFVERFDTWLEEKERRPPFLQGAVRERRGKRVEYFDHFVEAFDRERAGRAPSLGEVGRVLERRKEPYLRPFLAFLAEHYPVDDPFYEELAEFVRWSKEKLRDPAAHGRELEAGYEGLKLFREKLLFDFGGKGRGALAQLLGPVVAL